MKSLLSLSLFFVAIGGFFYAPSAFAHVLKTDGDIGAILHINPDDSPVSGTPTSFVLYFDDLTNKFSLEKCNCSLSIIENGQIIYNAALKNTSSLVSQNSYTFPKADVYSLKVTGQPKQPGEFQPFNLSYLVRVSNGYSANTQHLPTLLLLGIILMVCLVLLGAYTTNKGS